MRFEYDDEYDDERRLFGLATLGSYATLGFTLETGFSHNLPRERLREMSTLAGKPTKVKAQASLRTPKMFTRASSLSISA